jgi:hypothetical protein
MELNENIIKSGHNLMEMITKGYHWYSTPYGIWLINPDTKKWMLELGKSGDLWYYDKMSDTFSKYLNMERSDFQSFIKIWVEYVLKRGVVSTGGFGGFGDGVVEYVLKKGVVSTQPDVLNGSPTVEDVLKNGKKLK